MSRDYTSFITSQYKGAVNLLATVELLCGASQDQIDVALAIPEAFDVDTAEGVQLDVVGQWVGVLRKIMVPVEGVFFAFDTSGVGFDEGLWFGTAIEGQTEVTLTDTEFRRYIKAMILASRWNSQWETYDAILTEAMPAANYVEVKNTNRMELIVYVRGPVLSDSMAALLQYSALAQVKPAGVKQKLYILPT